MSEQRLIDANTLPVHRCTLIGDDGFEYETEIIYKFDIEDAPTINVEPRIIHKPTTSEFKRIAIQLGYEPVVHGHKAIHNRPYAAQYIYVGDDGYGNLVKRTDYSGTKIEITPAVLSNPIEYCSECGKRMDGIWQNYCDNCGAKMNGCG